MRAFVLLLLGSCASREAPPVCFEPTITQGVYGSATYVSDVTTKGRPPDRGIEPDHPIVVSQDQIENVVASVRTDGVGDYEIALAVGSYLITDDRSTTAPFAFSIEAGGLVRIDVEDLFVTESWGFGARCP